MPKKPSSKRLEELFDGLREESKPASRDAKKTPPRPVEKKPAPAAKRSALAQTGVLPPLETAAVARRGGGGTPSSLSLAFQMDSRSWATLQVVDEAAAREWDPNDQLLVRQVADQLSQALENARLFQETRARAEELSILNELNQKLSAQLDVNQVLLEIHRGAQRLIDAKNFYIGLYAPERNEVTFPLNVTESVIDKNIVSIPADQGMTGHILRTRKPLLIPENVTEAMQKMGVESVGQPAKCWMGVPLLLGEQVIGVMAAQSYTEEHVYDEHDLDLLTALAGQAAIAIQNARLFEETRQRAEELGALNRIVLTAGRLLDLKSLLESVLIQTLELLGFHGGLVSLYDESANGLRLIVHRNLPPPLLQALETSGFANSLCEQVYLSRDLLVLPDLREKSPVDVSALVANHVLAYFGIPLEAKGRVIGTLCMFNLEPRQVEPRMSDLARTIGIQIGFAIENARLFERTQRSEAELRALFAAMTDVIIIYDREGRYVRIAPTNPSRLFRPAEEMLGKTIEEVLPPSLHRPFLETIERALESGGLERIEYPLTIEGNEYWFEANVSKLTEDQVFWVARDITARKKAEEALKRRNEYLSATAEISQLVTSTLDMPTLFRRTVNLVRERFGFYHAGIFITEETGFNAVLQAATGEAGAEMLRQHHSLAVGSRSIVGQVTETGQAVVVNDTAASDIHRFNPLLPETRSEAALPLRVGSRTIGALDIQSTSPNAFTEDDIAVLQTLADQVAIAIDNARSYELSMQAVKEMREADKLKSQFLANMSHELRTPLNSIIGFSRVILKGIDGPVTDLQQQDLLAIHNSGQHLLGLINDILDLSRIEAGKMELTFDEVNLADLIHSVMSTVTGLVKDKPITLRRELPADLPPVRADAMRIRQVLLNLLSNAAKFTEEGSITVRASVSEGSGGQTEVTVSVADTGPGIAPEDQKKLFQPFSQVDASPTRKSGGSGLGLSISSHLIQMHGGRIGVESAPGEGSVFYFTLPALRSRTESETPPGKRIILAIDDDPHVVNLYERYLQPQGYQVVALSDPSRAVERARQLKPFAITLDIMMPGYDGWRVLHELKADSSTREIPVIVCSIVEEREKGFSLGAADYLVKPILEEDLIRALDRLNANGSIREVLIVDDDPRDLRLMGQMLSAHGRYHPILAEGGRNGWEILQARLPHAVILDLFMPEVDGFAILEKMRSNKKLNDVPVIVVSGGDLTAEQREQLQRFGQRLIQKSALTEQQLLAALERALQRVRR